MTYNFKTRNGVRTCDPCGKDEREATMAKPARGSIAGTVMGCSDARCPFKHPDDTPEAFAARVAELKAKWGVS